MTVALAMTVALTSLAVSYYKDNVSASMAAKAQNDLAILQRALLMYNVSNPDNIFANTNYPAAPNNNTNESPAINTKSWRNFSSVTLSVLIGTGIRSIPQDPWGYPYYVNSSAGLIASYGGGSNTIDAASENGPTTTGTTGKDIIIYYLPFELLLSTAKIKETGTVDGVVAAGDTLELTFNKNVRMSEAGATTDNPRVTDCSYANDWGFNTGKQPFNQAVPPGSSVYFGRDYENNWRMLDYALIAFDINNGFNAGKWVRAGVRSDDVVVRTKFRDFDPYYITAAVGAPEIAAQRNGKPIANSTPVQAALKTQF
ncbi:MAG: hypothetical protein HY851_05925 [candidate division Zixibacteria bacterium]|nr:hypothetical protein [candidate division Zixibacteria bacterium]